MPFRKAHLLAQHACWALGRGKGEGKNVPRKECPSETMFEDTPKLLLRVSDLKKGISGPNEVKIRSESGLGGGVQRESGPERQVWLKWLCSPS